MNKKTKELQLLLQLFDFQAQRTKESPFDLGFCVRMRCFVAIKERSDEFQVSEERLQFDEDNALIIEWFSMVITVPEARLRESLWERLSDVGL